MTRKKLANQNTQGKHQTKILSTVNIVNRSQCIYQIDVSFFMHLSCYVRIHWKWKKNATKQIIYCFYCVKRNAHFSAEGNLGFSVPFFEPFMFY